MVTIVVGEDILGQCQAIKSLRRGFASDSWLFKSTPVIDNFMVAFPSWEDPDNYILGPISTFTDLFPNPDPRLLLCNDEASRRRQQEQLPQPLLTPSSSSLSQQLKPQPQRSSPPSHPPSQLYPSSSSYHDHQQKERRDWSRDPVNDHMNMEEAEEDHQGEGQIFVVQATTASSSATAMTPSPRVSLSATSTTSDAQHDLPSMDDLMDIYLGMAFPGEAKTATSNQQQNQQRRRSIEDRSQPQKQQQQQHLRTDVSMPLRLHPTPPAAPSPHMPITVLVSEAVLDLSEVVLTLGGDMKISVVDAPLIPPVDLIIDERTAICLLGLSDEFAGQKEIIRTYTKSLFSTFEKFEVVWVIAFLEGSIMQGQQEVQRLMSATINSPIQVNIRACVSIVKDKAALSASVLDEGTVGTVHRSRILLTSSWHVLR